MEVVAWRMVMEDDECYKLNQGEFGLEGLHKPQIKKRLRKKSTHEARRRREPDQIFINWTLDEITE